MAPSLLALLAKILLFKRLRIILREASTPSSEKLKTLKSILLFYIFKYLCRIADRIVAVSKGVKSDFSEFYKIPYEMIEVIYNPVIFNWTQHIRNARPKYSGPPRLIFVGRIVRLKRLELQIEALSILIKKIPGVTLIICGDSPDLQYSDELVELANRLGVYKNIEFVGYQENVYSQLSRADYILLTSEYEGLPSVLIEALSVGVRVVACDCPNGPREILDNGRLGYLIPYDGLTAEAVANAIIRDALSPQKINFQDNHFIQFESEHVINQYLALMYAHNV
jgi:glycosyltransferase involved in cell wall biosynthesis